MLELRSAFQVTPNGDSNWWFFRMSKSEQRHLPVTTGYKELLEKVQIATSVHLPDMAYIYLVSVLVARAYDLAAKHNMKFKDKTDKSLFSDLGFRGVLPDALTEECLSALLIRNGLAHTFNGAAKPSDKDLIRLLQLCRKLEELA